MFILRQEKFCAWTDWGNNAKGSVEHSVELFPLRESSNPTSGPGISYYVTSTFTPRGARELWNHFWKRGTMSLGDQQLKKYCNFSIDWFLDKDRWLFCIHCCTLLWKAIGYLHPDIKQHAALGIKNPWKISCSCLFSLNHSSSASRWNIGIPQLWSTALVSLRE